MTGDAGQLLKRLERVARPGVVGQPAHRPQAPHVRPLESQSFDEMLTLVSSGTIRSGRDVEITGDVHGPLEPEQLSRLSAAADMAEAAGAKRALMLIDGRGLLMDVPGRAVTSEIKAAAEDRVEPIDAAVFVRDPNATAPPPLAPGMGLAGGAMPSMAAAGRAESDVLAGDERAGEPNH